MNRILTIALNTYKEAVRNKVFYIILLFALAMIGLSSLLMKRVNNWIKVNQ